MSRPRHVQGLVSAIACRRPSFIPLPRAKGTKELGLRYERAVFKAIPDARHNQWFYYTDQTGKYYCCPDIIIRTGLREVAILECKLTDVEMAREQLATLYIPVVAKALGVKAVGIVVTRNLKKESLTRNIVRSLADAIAATAHTIPTLHWLGHGPL